jgi:hypothetical protein
MNLSPKTLAWSTAIALGTASICLATPASAQLLPQVWGTVGTKDSGVSYGAGARIFDLGAEIGTGPQGATGVDVLKFISLPLVSPYVGLGWYSGKESIAYSGGVQLAPPGNTFYGVGYHSIRGINAQIGFKF